MEPKKPQKARRACKSIDWAGIKTAWLTGMTTKEVADRFKLSYNAVERRAKQDEWARERADMMGAVGEGVKEALQVKQQELIDLAFAAHLNTLRSLNDNAATIAQPTITVVAGEQANPFLHTLAAGAFRQVESLLKTMADSSAPKEPHHHVLTIVDQATAVLPPGIAPIEHN